MKFPTVQAISILCYASFMAAMGERVSSWLPSWGMCGVYVPKHHAFKTIVEFICEDCQNQLREMQPDALTQCASDCYTSDHFLRCARLYLNNPGDAMVLAKELRKIDAWWFSEGRKDPKYAKYVKEDVKVRVRKTKHYKKWDIEW